MNKRAVYPQVYAYNVRWEAIGRLFRAWLMSEPICPGINECHMEVPPEFEALNCLATYPCSRNIPTLGLIEKSARMSLLLYQCHSYGDVIGGS